MAGPIRISILANGRQARQEAARTATTFTGLGRSIARAGTAGGLAGLTFLAARFAKASVDLEAKYSTTMRTIQAATGASSQAMERLNDLAVQLGQDTEFSANDAAEAMLELSKAGITTRNIMGGGVAGTLQLAAAGGTELGTAATIASNAMNAFNLAGRDMDRIAAALAGGANASTASVESLGQALSQVGPGAVNAGLSLNETVAALAAFDSAGVKGSDAGTTLKTMLARLVPQTNKAATAMDQLGLDFVKGNGQFESLTNIAGQLNKKLGQLAPAQRQVALNTIFGSDASRAATILMRQGEAGIRKFIKATNDQNAAQEMAAARMGGTAGSLERLSGAVETAQLRLGQELAPTVQEVSDSLADNAVPAMEGAIDAAKTFGNAVEPLTDALKELGEIGVDAVKFIDDLPGPVKEIGIQAGIAALVLPRLSVGVTATTTAIATNIVRLQQWRAEMTYAVTRAQQVSAMMTRLGTAARGAAGIGGMVALTQSTQQANQGLRDLQAVAGGALLGFSVGGPVGAAVGGLAGAIGAVATASDGAADSMLVAKPKVEGFADSLSEVSGAATRAAQDVARLSLQQNGAFEAGRRLGIASRDLVQASLGQEGAMRRVERAVAATERAQNRYLTKTGMYAPQITNDLITLKNTLGATSEQFEKDQAAARQAALANGEFARSLSGIDKATRRKITTRIDMRGWPEGERQIARVIRGLVNVQNRKQIRTVLKTLGADESVKDVQRVLRQLQRADKARGTSKVEVQTKGAKADLNGWERSLLSALASGKRSAVRGGEAVRDGVEGGPRKARANLAPFADSVRTGVGPAKAAAASGGNQVGANLKSGVLSGFAGTAAALAAEAASAVRQAVAAAKQAGEIRSPSRRTNREVGKPLAQGIIKGFIDGMRDGSSGVERALDKMLGIIEKKYDGKKQAGRRKALLKSLRDERAELVKNGKAQDRNNRLLEKAEQNYKALRERADQYAAAIKSGFQTYGSIAGLGTTGGGSTITLPALLSQLGARATVAEEFAAVIESLRKKLNKTSLKQLLEQASSGDLEGALATAQAIATGGQGAIAQINQLTAQITAAGDKLGKKMRRQFFGHGLQVAEGTVKGLQKRQRELDRIAERLAKEFLRQAGLGTKGGSAGGPNKKTTVVGSSTPALDFVSARTTSTAPAPVNLNITVNAGVGANKVEIGKEVVSAVDAYFKAGGRARSKWGGR